MGAVGSGGAFGLSSRGGRAAATATGPSPRTESDRERSCAGQDQGERSEPVRVVAGRRGAAGAGGTVHGAGARRARGRHVGCGALGRSVPVCGLIDAPGLASVATKLSFARRSESRYGASPIGIAVATGVASASAASAATVMRVMRVMLSSLSADRLREPPLIESEERLVRLVQ